MQPPMLRSLGFEAQDEVYREEEEEDDEATTNQQEGTDNVDGKACSACECMQINVNFCPD